jgi:flagellar basal-body rod protein FlgG
MPKSKAVFANPKGLAPIGNNSYVETTASGSATTGNPSSVGYGSLMQFAVEKSNVNPVVELTNLIEAQRMYSMNTKVMTATEEMDRNLESVMR